MSPTEWKILYILAHEPNLERKQIYKRVIDSKVMFGRSAEKLAYHQLQYFLNVLKSRNLIASGSGSHEHRPWALHPDTSERQYHEFAAHFPDLKVYRISSGRTGDYHEHDVRLDYGTHLRFYHVSSAAVPVSYYARQMWGGNVSIVSFGGFKVPASPARLGKLICVGDDPQKVWRTPLDKILMVRDLQQLALRVFPNFEPPGEVSEFYAEMPEVAAVLKNTVL